MPHRVAVLNVVGLSPSLLGEATPNLRAAARAAGGIRLLAPPCPAVTCTSQAAMLTGLPVREHGVVANGWFDRTLQEIHFWKQSNRLMAGEKVWETARRRDPSITCANLFWWFNMGSTADISVTPRPMYAADGRKLPDCYTHPADLRDELQAELGQFPLFRFWGPGADIRSTDWIAAAARHVFRRHQPTLSLVYLPHLDYPLQKLGPDHPELPRQLHEVDRVVSGLIDFFHHHDVRVLVVSEYGIGAVSAAVEPNRLLREAGLLAVREERGRELLDPVASESFAVCDHQVAHVYVRDPAKLQATREALATANGIARVVDRAAQAELGMDHPRAGDLIIESEADRWFAYPYWSVGREPDFARTVDIHRKPGYDPCELFIDPRIRWPGLSIGWRLLKRRLGFRTLLDVVPIDPSLVRGSHGRVGVERGLEPILFGDGLDRFDPPSVASKHGPLIPMTSVRDAILAAIFD